MENPNWGVHCKNWNFDTQNWEIFEQYGSNFKSCESSKDFVKLFLNISRIEFNLLKKVLSLHKKDS